MSSPSAAAPSLVEGLVLGLTRLSVENFWRARLNDLSLPDECPNETYIMRSDGRWLSLPCKRRRCVSCGPRFWKKFTQRRMMSGLVGVDCKDVKVLCVTAPGNATDSWNVSARERFSALIVKLRALFPGARIEYWKVGEVQSRGLAHYHIIVRPLAYLPHELLEALCVAVGFGRVCWVQAVWEHKGGCRGLLGYLGKYLLKDVNGWDGAWGHVVTHSHGWSIDWKPRRTTAGGSPWEWHQTQLSVCSELAAREGLSEGSEQGRPASETLTEPLTTGLSPPVSLEKGGAVP